MQIDKSSIIEIINELEIDKPQRRSTNEVHVSKIFLILLNKIVNDICLLIDNNSYISIPILLRTLCGITIDLKNIKRDSTYIDSIALEYIKNKKYEFEAKESIRKLSSEEKRTKLLYMELEKKYEDDQIKVISESQKLKVLNDNNLFKKLVYKNLSNSVHLNVGYYTDVLSDVQKDSIRYKIKENLSQFDDEMLYHMINVNIYESIIIIKELNDIDSTNEQYNLNKYYEEL